MTVLTCRVTYNLLYVIRFHPVSGQHWDLITIVHVFFTSRSGQQSNVMVSDIPGEKMFGGARRTQAIQNDAKSGITGVQAFHVYKS